MAYRQAPKHPHPAAPEEIEEAVEWVPHNTQKIDTSRVAISGFSAGVNLALVASLVQSPKETFRHVIVVYPPTDLEENSAMKTALDPNGTPLADWITDTFCNCYVPSPIDRKGPTASPFHNLAEKLPDRLL